MTDTSHKALQIAIILSFVLRASATVSYAEEAYFAQYESWISNNLGRVLITALHIDSQGSFWIGTEDNLFVLRGSHIVDRDGMSKKLDGVLNSGVTDISQDESNNVYVSTFGKGIVEFRIDAGHVRHLESSPDVELNSTEKVFAFSNGLLWVVTQSGSAIIKAHLDQVIHERLSTKIDESIGRIHSIDRISDSLFLVGGERAIAVVDLESGDFNLVLKISELRHVGDKFTATFPTNKSSFYFGTNDGQLGFYDLATSSVSTPAHARILGNPRILAIKRYGNFLAISTDHGLLIADHSLAQLSGSLSKNGSTSGSYISDLVVEGNNLWLGTLSGVQLIRQPTFRLYTSEDGLLTEDVLHIEEDNKQRVWLGTFNGLYYYDSEAKRHYRFDNSENWPEEYSSRISALEYFDNSLFVGFIQDHGILQVDLDSLSIKPYSPFEGEDLNVLDIRADHTDIWVGTHGQGLIRFNSTETVKYLENGLFPFPSVNEVVPLRGGNIAIATIRGAYILKSNKLDYKKILLDLGELQTAPDILEVHEDEAGNVWIGTAGAGLFVLTKQALSHEQPIAKKYRFNSNLDTSVISNICNAPSGEFWMSAGNRVVRFFPDQDEIYYYDTNDGLPRTDISIGSAYCAPSGAIYFGSGTGYSRTSSDIQPPENVSRFSVVSIHAGEKNLMPAFPAPTPGKIVIRAHEFPLRLRFAVNDYLNPDYTQFRYRVAAQETHWNYFGGKNELRIENLDLGQHILQVQATNSRGLWSTSQIEIELVVRPSPWGTWWAYGVYALFTLLALWSMHRIYVSYIAERRSRELTIEIEETRNRAEDEIQEQLEYHDELAKAAHEHHSSILDMLSYCLKEAPRDIADSKLSGSSTATPNYMQALALLENCTIYDEGDVSIDLRVYVDEMFPAITSHCSVGLDTLITVNEVKDDPITLEIGTALAVMIYELATNALAHAYRQDSPANYLRVISRTEYSEEDETDEFSIIVRDSGEGIPEDAIESAPRGSGIALVRSLADRIDAEFSYSYSKGTMAKITLTDSPSKPIFA